MDILNILKFKSKSEKKEINIMDEYLKHYVAPHKKVSREVREKDIEKLIEDIKIMFNLCFIPRGKYQCAFAIAHSQINDKDPLRCFVTCKNEIVINPVIVRHTNTFVDSSEGCLSFPDALPIIVPRWNKIEVEYYSLTADKKLTQKLFVALEGRESKIYQHEIGHCDGKLIY